MEPLVPPPVQPQAQLIPAGPPATPPHLVPEPDVPTQRSKPLKDGLLSTVLLRNPFEKEIIEWLDCPLYEYALWTEPQKEWNEIVMDSLSTVIDPSSTVMDWFSPVPGETPLVFVLRRGFTDALKDMLKHAQYEDVKFFPNQPDTAANNRTSEMQKPVNAKKQQIFKSSPWLLHQAVELNNNKAVEWLIDFGYFPDKEDELEGSNCTPLHLAAERNNPKITTELLKVKYLLDNMATTLIDKTDEKQNTALHLAAANGHAGVCDELKAIADLTRRNVDGSTAFELAILENQPECAKVFCGKCLLDATVFDSGMRPLHLAVQYGYEKILQVFFLEKVDLKTETKENPPRNALEVALDFNQIKIASWLLCRDLEVWKFFLKPKLDANVGLFAWRQCAVSGYDKVPTTWNFEFIDDPFFNVKQLEYLEERPQTVEPDRKSTHSRHPLKIMADSKKEETKNLLMHPLVRQYINIRSKETKLTEQIEQELLVFVIFLLSYSFIFMISDRWHQEKEEQLVNSMDFGEYKFRIFERKNSTKSNCVFHFQSTKFFCGAWYEQLIRFMLIVYVVISASSSGYLLGQEIRQLWQFRWDYVGWENGIQLSICVTSLLTIAWKCVDILLWFGIDWPSASTFQPFWIISAFTIVLSWGNLLYLLRKRKEFGLFVLMFKNVAAKSLEQTWIFVLFLLAFSFSFSLLLQDKEEFSHIHWSFFKTLAMGTGEINYSEIFHGESEEKMPWLRYFAFYLYILFVVVIVVLMMNLLTALAIDEIEKIQTSAVQMKIRLEIYAILQCLRFLKSEKLRELSIEYPVPPSPSASSSNHSQPDSYNIANNPKQKLLEKLTQPSGIDEIALANLHILEEIRDQLKPIEPKLPKDEHEAKKGQGSIKLNEAETAKDEIQEMISRILDVIANQKKPMFETKLQHLDPEQHQPNNTNPIIVPEADESLEIPPGEDLGSIQEIRPEGSSAAGNLDSYVCQCTATTDGSPSIVSETSELN
ncbi:unnamed protein product, partial [Mesorhabditis belari]|uniref:Polycystin cation channel PKD1/PKD2 domain-containing protein n=1 Tax=Mesorhabditis belari TaxID=2138241 RepID=A0AAF3FHU5_9BILA